MHFFLGIYSETNSSLWPVPAADPFVCGTRHPGDGSPEPSGRDLYGGDDSVFRRTPFVAFACD